MPTSEPARPDLSRVDTGVRRYIESLEAEIERLKDSSSKQQPAPVEPPGPLNVITATSSGLAKRTPAHFYARQRRGGMGIFDLDSPAEDHPKILSLAEDSQTLLLITNYARAFRLAVSGIPESPIRARGASLVSRLSFGEGESLVALLPVQAQGYLVLLSKSGMVRSLRHHVFGEYMKPGLPLYDIKSFGPLGSVCWGPGDGDLLIATQHGRAIRFSEKLVPPQGCLGIRLAPDDSAVAITPVYQNSAAFMLGTDGRGTVRKMSGFAANKSPGSGGKIAMTTSQLAGIATIDGGDDVFILSRLSKIIRFRLSEIPVKEGVVQGVNCIALRADEAAALSVRQPLNPY